MRVLWLVLGWGLRAPGASGYHCDLPCDPMTAVPGPGRAPGMHECSHPSGPSHPASVLPDTLQLPASREAPACPQACPVCFRCLTPVDTLMCWNTFIFLPSASLAPLSRLASLGASSHFPSAIHALSCPRYL